MLRRRKYESRRGFTLVELVVVLVILAILTSVAVPAFSHQIDDAKEKKAVTEAQACVTAATGLTAQKYTEARTAYIQDNSKDIAVTLADWAGKVQDARPTITGTLAQREGTGEYLLAPQGTPDGSAAGAAAVKAAAGVDGTVLNFWCNPNGQIVYLLYKSADDILVAYANDANSGSNGIVIPTANVPTAAPTSTPIPTVAPTPTSTPTVTVTPTKTPNTATPTPTATPTVIDGPKLVIHIENGVTKEKIGGWSFKMYPLGNPDQAFIVTANSDGNIEVGINGRSSPFTAYYMREDQPYVLEDITVPDGYQAMQQTNFAVAPSYNTTTWTIDGINTVNINNKANLEYVTGSGNSSVLHIPRYKVPYIYFRKVDSNGARLSDANFTLMENSYTVATFTSDASKDYDYSIPVKQHATDGISSSVCIDLSGNDTNRTFTLVENTAPENYNTVASQKFTVARSSTWGNANAFDAEIRDTTWVDGYSLADDSLIMNHIITITDTPKNSADVKPTCKVTISKMVYTYASSTAEKPNGKDFLPSDKQAVLKLTGDRVSETWITQGSSKTFSLEPGTYKLEEITPPNGYLQALPITFTVKAGETSLNVEMLDTTTRDDTETIVIPGQNSTITLSAESWAHKLTTNDPIKLNSELLSMNGVLYYHYSGKIKEGNNPNYTDYADYFNRYGTLPDDAPTPIEFLNNNNIPGEDHVIRLTGTIYEWQENSAISLTKGDILIFKGKAYVYTADSDNLLSLNSNNFKDEKKRTAYGFSNNTIGTKYFKVQ